jgi:hypothetical protein
VIPGSGGTAVHSEHSEPSERYCNLNENSGLMPDFRDVTVTVPYV